jgi:hypothetical protein
MRKARGNGGHLRRRKIREAVFATVQPAAEGDGWVNWSGLATLLAEVRDAISTSVNRLLARQSGVTVRKSDPSALMPT